MLNKKIKKDLVYFGKTDFRNEEKVFGIKRKDRRQHMYIIGKSGTGKSALLGNLIMQDIQNGEGVCVVDPHGELAEDILTKIPESRKKDVIYFNPADTEFSIGFNVLELPDPQYKHLVASGLMGIFTKIWANVWSARMEYIMNNAILALLDTPGTTLLGIPRLLTDKKYRQEIINNLKDPVVKAFWVNEYEVWQEKFRNEAIAPIQNKVGQFLSTAMVRNIVGQSKSSIDIFDLMNQKKIFIVNVSKGRIGEDNSALLGAMLITKIQLAAMERVRIPENEREDFYLYVDEFQNFATESFAGVLSEARKYRLNLIIAHQYIGQLVTADNSTVVRDAVFGNVGTMLIFRVGVTDAEFLENEFAPVFNLQDMANLPNWRIYLKLLIDGRSSKPFSARTLPSMTLRDELSVPVREIINISRKNYAQPTIQVEKNILEWSESIELSDKNKNNNSDTAFHKKALSSIGSKKNKNKFSIDCALCGQKEKVPFKPTSGKPVYCLSCYKKVGERAVPSILSAPKNISPDKISESENFLADTEIQFTTENKTKNTNNYKKQNNLKKTNQEMKNALKNILKDLKKDDK